MAGDHYYFNYYRSSLLLLIMSYDDTVCVHLNLAENIFTAFLKLIVMIRRKKKTKTSNKNMYQIILSTHAPPAKELLNADWYQPSETEEQSDGEFEMQPKKKRKIHIFAYLYTQERGQFFNNMKNDNCCGLCAIIIHSYFDARFCNGTTHKN
jgi:hypothetical protein